MTRVTGETARELLDGATPGPWAYREGAGVVSYGTESIVQWVGGPMLEAEDGRLMASALELAEHVAWLYGAAGHDAEYRFRRWPLGGSWSVAHRDGYISIGPEGSGIGFRTPDEAVEAARALLAASEEARRD